MPQSQPLITPMWFEIPSQLAQSRETTLRSMMREHYAGRVEVTATIRVPIFDSSLADRLYGDVVDFVVK